MAPLAIFVIADELETLVLKRQDSLAISSLLSHVEASQEKKKTNLSAADNSAEEDQTGATEAAKLQLTQAPLPGHPHGHSAETTSMGSKGQKWK